MDTMITWEEAEVCVCGCQEVEMGMQRRKGKD